MTRAKLKMVAVKQREVDEFEIQSNLELINCIDQLNEKGNIQAKFKGLLFCPGQLAWEESSGIHCENKQWSKSRDRISIALNKWVFWMVSWVSSVVEDLRGGKDVGDDPQE